MSILISHRDRSYTYEQFEVLVDEAVRKLKSLGIGKHKVLIISHIDLQIEDFVWMDAVWINGGRSSFLNQARTEAEIDKLVEEYDPKAIIIDNEIKVRETKSDYEILDGTVYDCKTSGTTGRTTYKFMPFWWLASYRSVHGGRGVTIEQGVDLIRRHLKHKRIVMAEINDSTSEYPPYNWFVVRAMGGHYHIINQSDDPKVEFNRHNCNWTSTYPNALKRVIEKCKPGDIKLEGIQVSGQKCPEELLPKIRQWFNPNVITNNFGSSEGDLYLESINYKDTPYENFWRLKVLPHVAQAELRDGVLWYKHTGSDWYSDGDSATQHEDGSFEFTARENGDYVLGKEKIKVWVKPTENEVRQTVEGIKNVYMVQGPNFTKLLFYSGSSHIRKVVESVNKLQKYKRPSKIYHVKDEIFFIQQKFSRVLLHETLDTNPELVLMSSEIAV